jgi:ATP-binding cassette subfamily C protein LapB
MKLRTLTNSLSSWSHAVQTSVFAVIVFCGAPMVMSGDLTTGALVACSILGSRMIAPMAQMAQILSRYQHQAGSEKPRQHHEAADGSSGRRTPDLGQRAVRSLPVPGHGVPSWGGDRSSRMVLNSFTVEPGQKIALLGKNGAGKSTLLMALSGMIEPASGEAHVDHLSIAHIDPEDLRRDTGIVTQQSRLFYGTIRENVLLGAQDAPQSALLDALSITGADEFIRLLPSGLDHMIEEGGRGLSGGQQQALLLSRLIIRDPNIVLLDEPTASMDEATERLFISRFAAWSKGKTVVVATHRMRMLDLVERVVALDAGRIILDAPKAEALAKLRGTSAADAAKEVLAASKTAAANTDTVKPTKVRKPAGSRNKATAS